MLVGVGVRRGDATWPLYAGTFLAGFGIAIGGTLLPGLVKELFPPHRAGLVTGLYMLAMMGGAAVPSALSVPLADRLGSWQASLGSWSLLAPVGALAWVPSRRARPAPRGEPGPRPGRPALATPHRLARGGVPGPAVVEFYSCLAWLAPSYTAAGTRPTRATSCRSSRRPAVSGLLAPVLADRIPDRRVLLLSAAVFGPRGCRPGLAPAAAPWVWVAVLGLGQGAAFSLGLVLMIDYSRTPQAVGGWPGWCSS